MFSSPRYVTDTKPFVPLAIPLEFPNDDDPAYWDFLYFSYIIGTSGQTADVAFNTQQSRIIGTIHCVLSFFFNTAILASLINMSAGLIG